MFQIKSELNQIIGKLEELERSGSFSEQQLYDLLQKAYFIISDSFDIEQCHSTIHQIKSDMREIRSLEQNSNVSNDNTDILIHALESCKKELEVFVSHL